MHLLSELVTFARVVDAGGFSAAARQVGMTTSAVSRSVSRLEGHFGGRLLHRSTRAVSVTELGREVYAGSARIAQTARELEAFAGHYASAPNGCLKVAAPLGYGRVCVAPLLVEFLAQCPDVDVRLDLSDSLVDVVGEAVDVAIRIAGSVPLGLVARPLGQTANLLVARRHPLAPSGLPRVPADLAHHSVVLPGAETHLSLSREGAQASVEVPGRLRINDSEAILAVVEEGGGIGLVPDFAARAAVQQGRLVTVLPDWTLTGAHAVRPIQAVFSPTRHLPRKMRAFIDFMVGKAQGEPALPPALKRVA
jgi:DNA-binding transcriptional LysR family regulator